jgi:guanylate kinase
MPSFKNIFVIYGPSGSGQDSVIEGVQKKIPIERIVTTVTRPPRPEESQGHPYYFIDRASFEEKIKRGDLLEYVEKYLGVYYGVMTEEVERVAHSGKIGIWKVDFAGARDLKKRFPELTVIFINAPLDIIETRLRRRTTMTEADLQARLTHIREWLPKSVYDYKVENEEGKLEQTVEAVCAIIEKHSAKS